MFYWYLKRRINYAFRNNKRIREFRSFDSMDTVLILFDLEDREEVDTIAQDLRDTNKQVLLWTLAKNNHSINTSSMGMRAIKNEELSIWKILSDGVLNEFKSLKYDTLINLSKLEKEKEDALTYLLAIHSAKFCIGIEQPKEYKIFDFIMLREPGGNLVETYEQIKFYTKNNIRSK